MIRGRLRLLLPLLAAWLASALVDASGPDLSLLKDTIDRIINRSRGTVGVALIHVESGATLSVRGDEHRPMASVYKLPIAIELLAQVSAGTLSLDRPIALAPSDIRACCTLSRHHPRGGVTFAAGELLELMIVESDNTASDAILKLVGGPTVVERRMRALGFDTINVNRYEGDINFEMTGVANPPPQAEWTLDLQYRLISEVTPEALREARVRYTTSDPRDTSTPDDMARLLGRLQLGQYSAAAADHAPSGSDGAFEDRTAASQGPAAARHHRRAQDWHDRRGDQRRRHHHAPARQRHWRTCRARRVRDERRACVLDAAGDRADRRCVIRVFFGEASAEAADGECARHEGENATPLAPAALQRLSVPTRPRLSPAGCSRLFPA
jgi:beta-lactamase class A